MEERRQKIGILTESLAGGGAERSAGILSGMLEKLGHDVHLITVTDRVEYAYSGKLFNLGAYKNKLNCPINKLKRLVILRNYLQEQGIQLVLDFRFRRSLAKEVLVSRLIYRTIKPVYMVRSYHLDYYFPNPGPLSKKFFKNKSICVLTREIKDRVEKEYGLRDIKVIPNSIDLEKYKIPAASTSAAKYPFILAAGSMKKDLKQFDRLIKTYAASTLPGAGIHLRILGEGGLLKSYEELAKECGVGDKVHFPGFIPDLLCDYSRALFFVHCSKVEGFPRVILESLASGTPVIAMDCPTGPAELIDDGFNGLLIPADDFETFREAMDKLVSDRSLLDLMKKNAVSSVRRYDNSEIAQEWNQYLNSLYAET